MVVEKLGDGMMTFFHLRFSRSALIRRASPDRSLEYRKIDRPRVMRDRRDTDKLLRPVEQRRELRSRRLEGKLRHPVDSRGRTAHHISGLLEPIDAVEAGLCGRVDLRLELVAR